MPRKRFEPGQAVEFRRTPSSPFWHKANYVGPYTLHDGVGPWHEVQINADKHIVPCCRIRLRKTGDRQ